MAKKKKQEKKINKNKKETITTKTNIEEYNFPNGELYLRMNYLFRLAEMYIKQKILIMKKIFKKIIIFYQEYI